MLGMRHQKLNSPAVSPQTSKDITLTGQRHNGASGNSDLIVRNKEFKFSRLCMTPAKSHLLH